MSSARYFAYGSNMNPARVRERGLITVRAEAAWLDDFVLMFDKVSRQHPHSAHANIDYSRGERVEGVLYTLEADGEILKMDPFERAPINYGREAVQVQTVEGFKWAWTYFANPAVRRAGLHPERAYLDHLLAGRDFLSDTYVEMLQSTTVADR